MGPTHLCGPCDLGTLSNVPIRPRAAELRPGTERRATVESHVGFLRMRRCRANTMERVLENHGPRDSLEQSKVQIGLETTEIQTAK